MAKKKAWYKGIPAPVDADGEPIRIGDVLYSRGNECRVVSITVRADEACVGVRTDEGVFLPSVNPKYLSRKNPEPLEPEPTDSREGLPGDLDGTECEDYATCRYACGRMTQCGSCRSHKSTIDDRFHAAVSRFEGYIRDFRI